MGNPVERPWAITFLALLAASSCPLEGKRKVWRYILGPRLSAEEDLAAGDNLTNPSAGGQSWPTAPCESCAYVGMRSVSPPNSPSRVACLIALSLTCVPCIVLRGGSGSRGHSGSLSLSLWHTRKLSSQQLSPSKETLSRLWAGRPSISLPSSRKPVDCLESRAVQGSQ